MDARTRALFDVNIDDILAALGWENAPVLGALVRRVARRPALGFAREMKAFDDAAAASGLRIAAGALLSSFARRVTVSGTERIPPRGPALLLSNHPGMTDTLALFAAIPRPDLRVLAAERPFLRALPAVARSLIFIPERRDRRLGAMRQAIEHLRSGGALLTFPAGVIEPDPAVLPGAVEALRGWSESTNAFLRFVPQCTVVPLVVSGVLARRAQRHPLTLLRRRRVDRERLGAMLQVMMHTLRPGAWRVSVRVDIPRAFDGRELSAGGEAARAALMDTVAGILRLRGSA
jgi:putative hemolysin